MVFSSLLFLFAYLPLTLVCYYLAPRRLRNPILFLFSLLFYGWGEPIYIGLMLVSILSAYLFAFPIARYRRERPRWARLLMLLSVAVNLSFLIFFKYYPFFAENLSRIPGVSLPVPRGLKLPIGISFYTFQILSYTVDLYRGDCTPQRNFIAFGTYVTLFPQLIAGPIVRYREVDEQLTERRERITLFSEGISRFCVGLGKKVLLGDLLAAGNEYFRSTAVLSATVLGAWMTVILFSLHLYYDFSGYSDMAIGLGRMLGFRFPENFRYPYVSRSITEFWRRWHITLSTWFREYVYIPLGGNRCGRAKKYRNLAVVWLLTGLWHGADWNFILWGVYFLVILILEHAFLLRLLERLPRAVQHVYAILLILVGFLIFSFSDLRAGAACLAAMLGFGVTGATDPTVTYATLRLLPLLLVAAIGATPLPARLWQRLTEARPRVAAVLPLFCTAVLILCMAYLVDSTFSPFAYTQF